MSQAAKMLRDMAAAPTVQVVSRMGTVTRLARLALVAEQFGFMYGDTRQTGVRAPKVVLTMHRDPSPEAQQRAAENQARYPQAADGGDLPGMQPGGKLQPVPEAAAHVELLKARINFDLTGKNAQKRMVMAAAGLGAGCLVMTLRKLAAGGTVVGPLIIGALLLLVLGCGFLWNRKRNARFERVLLQAGLTPVQDHEGRTRYLPPGSRLPGQQAPFTQPGAGFPQQHPGVPGAQPGSPAPAAYEAAAQGYAAQGAAVPGGFPPAQQVPHGQQPQQVPQAQQAGAHWQSQPQQDQQPQQPQPSAQAPYRQPSAPGAYPQQPPAGQYPQQPPASNPYQQQPPAAAPHQQQPYPQGGYGGPQAQQPPQAAPHQPPAQQPPQGPPPPPQTPPQSNGQQG